MRHILTQPQEPYHTYKPGLFASAPNPKTLNPVTNFFDLEVAQEPNNLTFSQEKGDQKPKSSPNL
jgi:hypothetical protein